MIVVDDDNIVAVAVLEVVDGDVAVFVVIKLDCFFLIFGRVKDCLGHGGGGGCPHGNLGTPLARGMANPRSDYMHAVPYSSLLRFL